MRLMMRGKDGVRRLIDDRTWRQLERVLERVLSGRGAPPELQVREFLEAVLYVQRTGIPWRDLPACFGAWDAVYQRFRRWQKNGTWERLWRQLQIPGARRARRLFVDTTIVRAHQHAAGGGSNADEAKGRSRGGYTTKIHLAAADERTVLAVAITEGQAADAPAFDDVMMNLPAEECTADEVVADRAYDSDRIRSDLADADFKVTIPSTAARKTPIPHDPETYKERNRAERLVSRLKRMRRVATRYEKLGCVFLAMVHIACAASILF
jgi:transposase